MLNGDADVVIDCDGDGRAWRGTRRTVEAVRAIYAESGVEDKVDCFFEAGGGHRPYHGYAFGGGCGR